MKVTNRKVMNSIESLGEIQRTEIPAVLSYRLAKIILVIDPIMKAINMARAKLLDTYAEKDGDGNSAPEPDEKGNMMVKLSDPEKFESELSVLLDAENDMPIEPINISEMDGLSVKPFVFINLDWLFFEG